jgi:hypothetical protein
MHHHLIIGGNGFVGSVIAKILLQMNQKVTILDIIDDETKLLGKEDRKLYKIGAISYVGRTSKTRKIARDDIMDRIDIGQIDYGILVFKRGRKDSKNIFIEAGSKAWVNRYLYHDPGILTLFIDDGEDHIESTKYFLGQNNYYEFIKLLLFETGREEDLLDLIGEYVSMNNSKPSKSKTLLLSNLIKK